MVVAWLGPDSGGRRAQRRSRPWSETCLWCRTGIFAPTEKVSLSAESAQVTDDRIRPPTTKLRTIELATEESSAECSARDRFATIWIAQGQPGRAIAFAQKRASRPKSADAFFATSARARTARR